MMNRKKTKKAGLIKYALILPVTLTLILWSNAEVVSSSVAAVVENLQVQERMPEFPGGQEAKMEFLSRTFRYPPIAAENGVQARIVVEFTVTETGQITDVRANRFSVSVREMAPDGNRIEQNAAGQSLINEVKRVINAMPSWTPHEQNENVRQSLSVLFRLQGEGVESFSPAEPTDIVVIGFAAAPRITSVAQSREVQQNPEYLFIQAERMPEFPGGQEAKMQFLSRNIRYPVIAQENGVQGRVVVEFVVNETGEITNARVVESINPALDREAVRVINAMPNWTPGEQGGNRVSTLVTQGIVFRLQGVDDERFNQISMGENDFIVTAFGRQRRAEPDTVSEQNVAPTSSPSQDVHYVRGELRGNVIIVTNDEEHPQFFVRGVTTFGYGSNPLILLDGVEIDMNYLAAINPDIIKSFSVLKNESAIALYGERGRNGVIIITTRNNSE